jgi:C_GCAxxG_C_C family probable redox protein
VTLFCLHPSKTMFIHCVICARIREINHNRYPMPNKSGIKAREYFLKGHSCSESVLISLAEEWNLPKGIAPRAGSALGGGVGASGEVCGAITGAAVALGLYKGRDDITDEVGAERKKKLYVTMRQLSKAFTAKFGAVTCRQLIELDLSDPDQLEIFKQCGKRSNLCTKFVAFAADWMTENLDY